MRTDNTDLAFTRRPSFSTDTSAADAAAASAADVSVEKDGRRVNAKSVLSVLTLDCHRGDQILISVEGDGAEATLADLVALVESKFGEDEATEEGPPS